LGSMEPRPDEFRMVMGHFATGISVVTTFAGG
jgi:flavin reductase (DIM6/NTAB) family NADH-FMN oxidoreductase RutF